MKILTRYTIKEAFYPMLVGTSFFTFAFVLELLPRIIGMIVNKGAPLFKSIELFVYLLPFNIAVTIPMAVLMASITAFSRLSSDSEVVAMKALSFPTLRIYKPIIFFGILAFLFSLFFNNVIMPAANYRYRALTIYILNIKPSLAIEALQFVNIPETSQYIGAEDSDGQKIKNVVLYDLGHDGTSHYRIITASDGIWHDNQANSSLVTLELTNGMIQDIDKRNLISNEFTTFNTLDINFPRSVQESVGGHKKGLREMPFWEIKKEIDQQKEQKEQTIDRIVSNKVVAAHKESGSTEDLEKFEKKYLKENKKVVKQVRRDQARFIPYYYYIEYQKAFSIPASCFVVVFLGAPLGIVSKRSGKGGGFGLSIIVIAIYYGIMIASEALARSGNISPSLTMWLPNIILFAVGLGLMIRSIFERGK